MCASVPHARLVLYENGLSMDGHPSQFFARFFVTSLLYLGTCVCVQLLDLVYWFTGILALCGVLPVEHLADIDRT